VLEWVATGARSVVAVHGDLDLVPAARLEAFLAEQPLAGCAVLEIDLAAATSVGSVGLSALLAVRRWSLQRGIELRIRGAAPSVWRVFELTGLAAVFTAPREPLPAPVQDLVLF
jgi:anti-anti-sigma factor